MAALMEIDETKRKPTRLLLGKIDPTRPKFRTSSRYADLNPGEPMIRLRPTAVSFGAIVTSMSPDHRLWRLIKHSHLPGGGAARTARRLPSHAGQFRDKPVDFSQFCCASAAIFKREYFGDLHSVGTRAARGADLARCQPPRGRHGYRAW